MYTLSYIADVSSSAGEKGFSVFLGKLGRALQETVVSSKAVPELSDVKYRSEFKHGFTNRGCLHCATLKALHDFQEKEPTSQGIRNFSFKMFKMRF